MSRAALNAFIDRVRALQGLPAETAKQAAPLVEKAFKTNAAAGLDPYGKPWPPTKKGGRALEHAADHLSTTAEGSSIVTTLEGVEVFHDRGVKGSFPRRQILPSKGTLPDFLAPALEQGAGQAFAKIMGGT